MLRRRIAERILVFALLIQVGLSAVCPRVLVAAPAAQPPEIKAEAAFLLELNSGEVLYSKSAEQPMFPASLTKLLTALVVLEHGGDLEQTVVVGQELWWVKPDSSRAGLRIDDRISLRNLFYAMLLPSGNDAAYVMAVHTARAYVGDPRLPVSQAVQTFSDLMNQTAAELGVSHSSFVNPDGYHDPEHYSTARDLAIIAEQVLRQEFLRQVVGRTQITVSYVSRGRWISRSYLNTNRLINPDDPLYLPQAVGLKTGTTVKAGPSLASAASANQLDLLAIVLNSDQAGRWEDSRALLYYGLESYQFLLLCSPGEPQAAALLAARLPGFYAHATLLSQEERQAFIANADEERITTRLVFDPSAVTVRGESLIINSHSHPGSVVGELVYQLDQEELGVVPLVLGEEDFSYLPSDTAVLTMVGGTILLGLVGYLLHRRHLNKE